jgi:hypothetical protein
MTSHRLQGLALGLALSAGVSRVASAQDQVGGNTGIVCDAVLIIDCGGGGDASHETAHGSSWMGFHGDFDCWVCEGPGGPVNGNECHGFCADHLTSSQQITHKKLLAAAQVGDVANIVTLSRLLPGYALYNVARNSIQIRACEKSGLIANIPLSTAAEQRLAQGLVSTTVLHLAARHN